LLLENGTLSQVEVRKNLRGWVTLEAWEIDGVRYEICYGYDDVGNRTSMTYPDGTTVSFEYNERNQLVRIPGFFEGPAAGVWTDNAGFRYDANGFLIGMRAVNGIETTFQPDERNRLKQISSPPLTLTYAYTPGGNVASITDASYGEPFTTTYGYDGTNRLISAQVHMPTGIETVQYLYDALGNRIKESWTDSRGAIDYRYLPGNYLEKRGDTTTYSWGSYGQLILKDEQPNALGGETNYDYNARRLMTQVRVDDSPVAQFFYDAYGRRVKIVEGGTTTITLYSGNDIVYEVKTQPGQPTVTTKYLVINGKYLAKVVQEGTNQPQTYFYHTDLVGSVRAITDSQGQVVVRFEYEPFGVTVQASGPLAGDEVHKFTGKPEDAAIDLYYFNARYHDPVIGRFVQQDPARDGLNWYTYVAGDPLSMVDPDGNKRVKSNLWMGTLAHRLIELTFLAQYGGNQNIAQVEVAWRVGEEEGRADLVYLGVPGVVQVGEIKAEDYSLGAAQAQLRWEMSGIAHRFNRKAVPLTEWDPPRCHPDSRNNLDYSCT
jgi:RHS repeat-associated protein